MQTKPSESLKTFVKKEHTRRFKIIVGALIAVVVAGLGFAAYQNPQLFRASITEGTIPAGANALYIPNYTAGVGDQGLISLKTRAAAGQVVSIEFKLNFNPANGLIFNNPPIVFDSTTVFQDAFFKSVTTSPGQALVSFGGVIPVTLPANSTVAKLSVKIDPSVAPGASIALTASDVTVLAPSTADPAIPFAESTTLTAIDTGTITLVTQDKLRVLNAEAIDATHVRVNFSDLLQTTGAIPDYVLTPATGPALAVSAVERGDARGLDQRSVVLTTAAQLPGTRYTLAVGPAALPIAPPPAGLSGNTDGKLNANYRNAIFYGFGQPTLALSDFRITGAAATAYKTATVTFSDPPTTESVTPNAFTILDDASALVPVTDASANGNVVTLTLTGNLLKSKSYKLTVDKLSVAAPLRASDNAKLGVNVIGFTGFKNGPRVVSASVDATNKFTINFDEPIQSATGAYGSVSTTGTSDMNFGALNTGNTTLAGSTLTYLNAVTLPAVNYTVTLNDITDSDGVSPSPDPAFNSVTFWGAGHVALSNSIGTVTVTKKDVLTISPGTLPFASVTQASLAFVNPATGIGVASTSVNTDGSLKIVTTSSFVPGTHYVLRFNDGSGNLIQTAEWSLGDGFNMVSARASTPNEVLVSFSENVDSLTVTSGAFHLSPAIGIGTVTVDQNFKDVHVPVTTALQAGVVYTLTVDPTVRSFAGGKVVSSRTAAFGGFQSAEPQSTAQIITIKSDSPTSVTVTFSAAIDPASVTPVNLAVNAVDPNTSALTPLTVSSITSVSPTVFTLTTASQAPDVNYFVSLNGVKDAGGGPLGNTRVSSFFGFIEPVASVVTVSPVSITNDVDKAVVLSGQNLNIIKTARVGTSPAQITDQPATGSSLTIDVPPGLTPGSFDITLVTNTGISVINRGVLLITTATKPFRVVSDQSLSTPARVLNDGKTNVTLWALVEDPVDIAGVDSVTINLEQIGGIHAQEMTKDAATQKVGQQFFKFTTTVPATVATQTAPYLLPVEARNGSTVVQGTASVIVTKDILKGVPPSIDQLFASPISAAPDATTPVTISAQVSDTDGADTITSVVANLGPLGAGFVPLTEVAGSGVATEQVNRFFASAPFTIPTTTKVGTYPLSVIASNATGETSTQVLNFVVSNSLTGPSIDSARSSISPRKSVPRDGKTPFTLNAYVADPSGMDDIATVTANFGAMGLSPVTLTRAADATGKAKVGWFASAALTVPPTTALGVYQIEVIATSQAGASANLILQLDVTDKDTLGDPPFILSDRSYTTPQIGVNDGTTPMTLYAFVRDSDDDLDSVVVNLSTIGQVGTQPVKDFSTPGTGPAPVTDTPPTPPESAAGSAACPTNSTTLVCMTPSVKEGTDGQWFILPNVTIRKETEPSSKPYDVEIVATDKTGKTAKGTISVSVNNGGTVTNDKNPPKLQLAVATDPTTVELVFNEEIAASTVSSTGAEFTITDRADITKVLPITAATINADGNIVTLTTAPQTASADYMVSASAKVTDAIGVPLIAGASNRVPLTGFVANDNPPVVELITATDANTVEIEFRDFLKPTSLVLTPSAQDPERLAPPPRGGMDYNVEIFESGETSTRLDVLAVHFGDAGNVLIATTASQKSNQLYRLNLKELQNAGGTKAPVSLNKQFRGFNSRAIQSAQLKSGADLNGDGKVDFTDFTMFAAVYGSTIGAPAPATPPAPDAVNGGGPGPITPAPDSTVPHSSPPAGGDTPTVQDPPASVSITQ